LCSLDRALEATALMLALLPAWQVTMPATPNTGTHQNHTRTPATTKTHVQIVENSSSMQEHGFDNITNLWQRLFVSNGHEGGARRAA
jgi:hypothetical protein